MITDNTTLKTKRKAKQKAKLTMAATSIAIFAVPLFSLPETTEAITTKHPIIQKQTVQQDEDELLLEYKLEQLKIATQKRIEAEQKRIEEEKRKAEEWRKQKEEEARLHQLQIERENFFYIVKHKDITYADLRTASGLTVEEANVILKGTGLEGLGKGFVDAEEKHGVNAYYLMAHAAWESEWGKSSLAVNKNNLFGFTAYDASPGSSATSFASKEECIDKVAAYIRDHYLEDDGQHHNGPTLRGMNIKYASDENWATGIGSVITNLVAKAETL